MSVSAPVSVARDRAYAAQPKAASMSAVCPIMVPQALNEE